MNIDGGGWTLVATVHENDIRTTTGRCGAGDKWSSENGNRQGSQTGAEAWSNYATFGNVISATSEDYKNPAYFGIQARDVMIWQVPNDTPLQQFDSAAYMKFRTTNGFLINFGGNMFNLYSDFFPIKSEVYRPVLDNGPAVPVVFDRGSAAEVRRYYGPESQTRTDAGFIEVSLKCYDMLRDTAAELNAKQLLNNSTVLYTAVSTVYCLILLSLCFTA